VRDHHLYHLFAILIATIINAIPNIPYIVCSSVLHLGHIIRL